MFWICECHWLPNGGLFPNFNPQSVSENLETPVVPVEAFSYMGVGLGSLLLKEKKNSERHRKSTKTRVNNLDKFFTILSYRKVRFACIMYLKVFL